MLTHVVTTLLPPTHRGLVPIAGSQPPLRSAAPGAHAVLRSRLLSLSESDVERWPHMLITLRTSELPTYWGGRGSYFS